MDRKGSMNFAENPLLMVPPRGRRYSLEEWYLGTKEGYRRADDERRLAERLVLEAERVMEESSELAVKDRRETDHQLGVKIADIEFQKETLERQVKEVDREIEALLVYKERIQDCQKALSTNCLEICEKCMALREMRLGLDLCCDDPERELEREAGLIRGVQGMITRLLEEVKEQIRRLRAIRYTLTTDLGDKGAVLLIDKENSRLKETDLSLALYHGKAPLDPASITQEEWLEQTKRNMDAAARELLVGKPLRAYVDTLLKQMVDDLWAQYELVNKSFLKRIQEQREAKERLVHQHSETVKQVKEVEDTIYKLKRSLAEKEGFMALAQTRLGNRCQRENAELCRDEAETYLVNEVTNIRESVMNLQQMLLEAEASLRYLLRTQVQLEEDINIKINSLKIDEVDCMTLRKGMDYHAF